MKPESLRETLIRTMQRIEYSYHVARGGWVYQIASRVSHESSFLAPFLGNPDAEREIGAPLAHVSGKTWVVALYHGEPIGCGAVFLPEGAAELASAYVLPKHRGRGVYSALVDARLRLAADRPVVTALCRARASEVLARRGFVYVEHAGSPGRTYARMRLVRWLCVNGCGAPALDGARVCQGCRDRVLERVRNFTSADEARRGAEP